jgi:osmoprotectant transport system permease protein
MTRHATRCLPALAAILSLNVGTSSAAAGDEPPVVIASKVFTESVILGEIMTGLLDSKGIPVTHRRELGGTRILWNALEHGEIDAYAEYTGTILREVLASEPGVDESSLETVLARHGVGIAAVFGFNNTYVLGMRAATAEALRIERISDLRAHPELRLGLSNEFLSRVDGWPGLRAAYRLPQDAPRGMQHDLAYRALESEAVDIIDLYSTDAEIEYYSLRRLKDDLGYFPRYDAVILYRLDLRSDAVAALRRLDGVLDEDMMVKLNAEARIERRPERAVAAGFLRAQLATAVHGGAESRWRRFIDRSLEHLALVGLSLGVAILVAIPLGILAYLRPRLGEFVLGATGIIQTIPALALLVFMIPWLGIGAKPAIAALFLYSLLPIVRNTHVGLRNVPPDIRESAIALGLPTAARLSLIELPMAGPSILAGIKTAAVINIGTATLGALIGAGGYGEPILTGIRLDDIGLILEGAIPAAALALLVQGAFELAERRWAGDDVNA